MIRFSKPVTPPTILASKGIDARNALCAAREAGSSLSFDSSLYAAEEVKQALIAAQHGKCCFCERKVFEDGDVEHFRPKAAVKQAPGARRLTPGYYWLAYDWDNLLLCCPQCNSREKGNLFPLADEKKRVRTHRKAKRLSDEEPLFIDPSREDPADYIEFRDELPIAPQDNARGKETIRALGLDRPALNMIRYERLEMLRQFHKGLRLAEEDPDDSELQELAQLWRDLLAESVVDSAEFAAMARAAAARGFRPYAEEA